METDTQYVRTVDGLEEIEFPITQLETGELLALHDWLIMELEEAGAENQYNALQSLGVILPLVSSEIVNRLARSYMQRHEVDEL